MIDPSMLINDMRFTTRPPHRIFFFENGDTVERVIPEDLLLSEAGFGNNINGPQSFGIGSFGGREVLPLDLNRTGFMDSFVPSSKNFSPYRGDGSSSSIAQSDSPQIETQNSYLPMALTPQQFLHIKVSIPRSHYTTRLYQGSGDVDIVEVISKPNSMLTARNVDSSNVNFGSPQPSVQNSVQNPYNSGQNLLPQTGGWSSPGSWVAVPNQRTTSGFRQTQPIESPVSPYSGSSTYGMGNSGQYNLPNNGGNRPSSDYGAGNQYVAPIRLPAASEKSIDSPAQNGQQFLQGGQPSGLTTSQIFMGQPNPNPNLSRSLFFSSRFRPGMPTSFANADTAIRNTQPQKSTIQNVLNAVRSLDDGKEPTS